MKYELPEPGAEAGVCPREAGEGERLVEALRRGDGAAFEAVARAHAPRLFRLATSLVRNRSDAEDLVQETLVRALRTLPRFEGRAQLSTYLVRSLGNIWKNQLRSRKRSRVVDWLRGREPGADTPRPEPADPAPSAQARFEARERARGVREAVLRLDPTRRLTLLLREVEELSYEEIAEMTGVPIGTVRSRLARAREDLRRLLEFEP